MITRQDASPTVTLICSLFACRRLTQITRQATDYKREFDLNELAALFGGALLGPILHARNHGNASLILTHAAENHHSHRCDFNVFFFFSSGILKESCSKSVNCCWEVDAFFIFNATCTFIFHGIFQISQSIIFITALPNEWSALIFSFATEDQPTFRQSLQH